MTTTQLESNTAVGQIEGLGSAAAQGLRCDAPAQSVTPETSCTEENDVWQFGWRYERQTDSQGKEYLERLPLAYEDLLHPEEDDVHVTTQGHDFNRDQVYEVLEDRCPPNRQLQFVRDTNTDLDLPDVPAVRPDLGVYELAEVPETFLEQGTIRLDRTRDILELAVEVTSPTNQNNDFVPKLDYYGRAGFRQYIIIDRAYYPQQPIELVGYLLQDGVLVRQQLDEQGRLSLPGFELSMCVEEDAIVLYDGDVKILGRRERANEAKRRADAAEKRADEATERATKAEKELQELRAQIARLQNSKSLGDVD